MNGEWSPLAQIPTPIKGRSAHSTRVAHSLLRWGVYQNELDEYKLDYLQSEMESYTASMGSPIFDKFQNLIGKRSLYSLLAYHQLSSCLNITRPGIHFRGYLPCGEGKIFNMATRISQICNWLSPPPEHIVKECEERRKAIAERGYIGDGLEEAQEEAKELGIDIRGIKLVKDVRAKIDEFKAIASPGTEEKTEEKKTVASPISADIKERLQAIQDLKNDGVLTEEEYGVKRAEILATI